jgi:2'-5' RNA ligase
MRLFVAAELSQAVVAAAMDCIGTMRARVARLAAGSRITWITAERLHVTIRFIGHVSEAHAASILDALRPPLNETPFNLSIAGVGTFPPTGSPRVVWAGVKAGRDRLVALEEVISGRLADVGVAREARPFNPHLTLARVREAAGLRSQALLQGLADTVLGSTPLDAITLFESRLSAQGPQYQPLQRTPLT